MKQKRTVRSDKALQDLKDVAAGLGGPEALQKVHAALESTSNQVVARASHIIKDKCLTGFDADLLAAFDRFRFDGVKRDPGCIAKVAVLEALDFNNYPHPEPFLTAAGLTQMEPVWGGSVDTAAGVRARAILALANMGYPDLLLVAGELLADAEAGVRQAAADAIAHSGARAGAGVLLLALANSDELEEVQLACLSALLAVALDWGLPRAKQKLLDRDPRRRELAALALGECRSAEALDVLLECFNKAVLASERAIIMQAVGRHRSDRALEWLLSVIQSTETAHAVEAMKVLEHRRGEPRVRQVLEDAMKGNPELAKVTLFRK